MHAKFLEGTSKTSGTLKYRICLMATTAAVEDWEARWCRDTGSHLHTTAERCADTLRSTCPHGPELCQDDGSEQSTVCEMSSRCAPPVTSHFLVQLRWDDQTQVKAYHHWLHKLNYYSIGRAVAGAPFWVGFVTFFNTYQFFYGCSFQAAVYIKNK